MGMGFFLFLRFRRTPRMASASSSTLLQFAIRFFSFFRRNQSFFFFFNTVRRRRFEIFEISQVTRSTTHNRPVTELLTSTSPLRKGLDIRFPRFNDDTRQQSFRLHLSGNARFPKIFPSEINEFQRLLERKGFAPSP